MSTDTLMCADRRAVPAGLWRALSRSLTFIQGQPITIRPVQADDVDSLASLIAGLSARSLHQRYLAVRSFTQASARAEAERIAAARTPDHVAFVAGTAIFGDEDLIGVAEVARMPGEAGVGELAVVVRDEMQGVGVGSQLVRGVAAAVGRLGIGALHVELMADNNAMRRLAAHVGAPLVLGRSDGTLQLRVRLAAPD